MHRLLRDLIDIATRRSFPNSWITYLNALASADGRRRQQPVPPSDALPKPEAEQGAAPDALDRLAKIDAIIQLGVRSASERIGEPQPELERVLEEIQQRVIEWGWSVAHFTGRRALELYYCGRLRWSGVARTLHCATSTAQSAGRAALAEVEALEMPEAPTGLPEDRRVGIPGWQAVWESMLAHLSADSEQRTLLQQHYVDGKPLKAIAADADRTSATVSGWHETALTALADALRDAGVPPARVARVRALKRQMKSRRADVCKAEVVAYAAEYTQRAAVKKYGVSRATILRWSRAQKR